MPQSLDKLGLFYHMTSLDRVLFENRLECLDRHRGKVSIGVNEHLYRRWGFIPRMGRRLRWQGRLELWWWWNVRWRCVRGSGSAVAVDRQMRYGVNSYWAACNNT